ncbi:hypothetical protein AYL99_07935 [Fonsecaea erecta]|uniref:Uncharacterized protein n=1 Tax=Fonsecaea erecta TaxID=1367422 RepID=A0A178ZBP1_9EURO|nr:hypothetical protein AYL99_07935 [Fonsecaea erecta]OAP57197.1 hypothetical protein AYL99_07935 [Fonsecaea erecta]
MAHPAGYSARVVIDLLSDSDDDSVIEIQALPVVKDEKDEAQIMVNSIQHDNELSNTMAVAATPKATNDEFVESKDYHVDTRVTESNYEASNIKPPELNFKYDLVMPDFSGDQQSGMSPAQPKNGMMDNMAVNAEWEGDDGADDGTPRVQGNSAHLRLKTEQIDVDFWKTLNDSSNAQPDSHLHATPPEYGSPFDIDDPEEPLEGINLEATLDSYPFSDMNMELDGFDAILEYNRNKAHFFDRDVAANDESVRDYAPPPCLAGEPQANEMDWNTILDEYPSAADDSAAAAFAIREKEYERKKEEGSNTPEDDIRFATEKIAEHRRLRDIARSKVVVKETRQPNDLPPGYQEADSLFFPEAAEPLAPVPKKNAAPKPRNGLTKKELQEALSVGIDAGFGEAEKPKRKTATFDENRRSKKRRGTNKDGGTSKLAQKRGRKQRPCNLSNIQSLGQTNIVDAAQANASRDMPTFTSSNKNKALQELLASIPSSERGAATSDRQAILAATMKFKGHGSVRSDNHGGWKLRGMESSLYNHQLLGAAFMRDRETGDSKPKGGMVCDEMGFGKTIQMIANILDGKAEEGSNVKTTLIVAPPTLLTQWMDEMNKHVKGRALGRILRFHSGSRLVSNDIQADLRAYDVILTTYSEVQKSYPSAEPPMALASVEKKKEWWQHHFLKNVGPLHQIKYHRIVLDEAHNIKNRLCKTSIAVRGLIGNHRWCITGTPILNSIEELFPYFSFLRVPHTGDYATFCHNYCNNRVNRDPVPLGRIHNILRAIMLRRTHVDTLFNAPIIKLPGITHNTVMVEFNPVERHIYNMVKSRYIQQINTYSKSGTLNNNYGNILGMLMRLRMLCAHLMLCQDVLKRMFVASDIEILWRLTDKEVQASHDTDSANMIKSLRKMLAANENTLQTCQTKELQETFDGTPNIEDDGNMDTGSPYGLTFKFRKFLRALTTSKTWAELHLRSICAKCRMPPDEPVCTSCFHVYCQECINAMHEERKKMGDSDTKCIDCGTAFEETSSCAGLKELGFNSPEVAAKVEKKKRKLAKLAQKAKAGMRSASPLASNGSNEDDEAEGEEREVDWLDVGGRLLPSAKLSATKAAILNWKNQYPGQKIIVYTQFLGLSEMLSNVCLAEGWGYVQFNGKMTIDAREKATEKFRSDPKTFIMICSLKAGGVGLNLSMASKVIILDLWFNSSIEAQAYCRAFRIGQAHRVDVIRFVVKNSIDEDLIRMQDRKDVEVTSAIGPDHMGKRATIQQLLQLFGEVKEQGQNEFILVEEESEDDADNNDPEQIRRALVRRAERV